MGRGAPRLGGGENLKKAVVSLSESGEVVPAKVVVEVMVVLVKRLEMIGRAEGAGGEKLKLDSGREECAAGDLREREKILGGEKRD